jgi:hypothetical protein
LMLSWSVVAAVVVALLAPTTLAVAAVVAE